MIESSVACKGTRHHRADRRFLDLFEEDFGIRAFYAYALEGIPMKQAIAVAQWAADNIADPEDRGAAVMAWARKRGVGHYDRRLLDAPELTYEQSEHERRLGRG